MIRGIVLLLALASCSGDDGPQGRDPEDCDNGADDDLDGRVDCDDSDCWATCAENCTDGIDNNRNGLLDCYDPACDGQCGEVCDDGRDNDGDGLVDCADRDCSASCPEDCGNGVDDDGDGLVDCADDSCDTSCDADGDGYITTALGGDDCDDTRGDVNPAATEVCNDLDDDCDGDIDDADSRVEGASEWYVDDDGDGYGSDLQRLSRCDQPAGTVTSGGDCDDDDPDVNPDGIEVCNAGVDDDCNGSADDDDPNLDLGSLIAWYTDNDGDGWGVPSLPVVQCAQPPGRAANDDDCNDNDASVLGSEPWLEDTDGDGYGAGTPSAASCTSPGAGWVRQSVGLDCDDSVASTNPGAVEVCSDGIDQDCDGVDFTGCNDTAVYVSIFGDAQVDPVAGTYSGTEVNEFLGASSGYMVCQWTWTATDWAHDPTAVGPNPFTVPCRDFDGNACDWGYTVHMSAGAMTDGFDCAFYGLTPAASTLTGPYGYGWMDDYRAGGISYGPTMMYHNPANPTFPPFIWASLSVNSITPVYTTYDDVTGEFLYDWPDVALLAAP